MVKQQQAPGRVTCRPAHLLAAFPDGVPGPKPAGNPDNAPHLMPRAGEELCYLAGDWRIFQQHGGHRYSTDDIVTAWVASQQLLARNGRPDWPWRCLDLGCGIGSVLMFTAWSFPNATCVGIEAQSASYGQALRSIEYNGAANRCSVHLGDIRDPNALPEGSPAFDLVTGTPPYFRVQFDEDGEATTEFGSFPTCRQSAPARYEFRGGVEAYVEAAARYMAPDGVFVCTEGCDTNQMRVEAGAATHGLVVTHVLSISGKTGKAPLFQTFTMRRPEAAPPGVEPERTAIAVRDETGQHTLEYAQLLLDMGIPTIRIEQQDVAQAGGS